MSAQGIRAGKAYVELFADGSKLNEGLARASERLKRFGNEVRQLGSQLTLLGAAAFAPVVLAVRSYEDALAKGELVGDRFARAVQLRDALTATQSAVRDLSISVGDQLAPVLSNAINRLGALTQAMAKWVDGHPSATRSVAALAFATVGLGAALTGIGLASSVASFGIKGFTIATRAGTAATILFGAAVRGLGAALVATRGLAAVALLTVRLGGIGALATGAFTGLAGLIAGLSPAAGLAAGAVAGLGLAVVATGQDGRSWLRLLGDSFGEVASDAKTAWSTIVDAVSSGDLSTAMKTAWALAKLEMTNALLSMYDFGASFVVGLSKLFNGAGEQIAKAWINAEAFMAKSLARITTWLRNAYDLAVGGLAVGIAKAGEKVGAVPKGTADAVAQTAGQDLAASQQQREAQLASDLANYDRDAAERLAGVAADAKEQRAKLGALLAQIVQNSTATVDDLRGQLQGIKPAAAPEAPISEEEQRRRDVAADKLRHAADMQRQLKLDDLWQREHDLKDRIAALPKESGSAAGTFSAAAARGIGLGSNAAERTASAAEGMLRELKSLHQSITKLDGTVFA